MKTNVKRGLFLLTFVVYYCISTLFFAWLVPYFNIASIWFNLYLFGATAIIVIPTIVGLVFTVLGRLDNIFEKKPKPEYDINLLEHAVVNQMEADFESKDFTALSEMLQHLIKGKRDNIDVLHSYLTESSQENLKDGTTVKRWDNE